MNSSVKCIRKRLKEGCFMEKFAIFATLFRKYFTEQGVFCNFAVYN